MSLARSVALFALTAAAEIGGAWLVWQGVGAAICLAGGAVIMYAPRPA